MKTPTLALLMVVCLSTALAAQQIPGNAQAVSGGKGWVCNTGYVERANACIILGLATDEEVRRYLIQESLASYPGSCPCPYNGDRAGRRCGGRSAYSRPGGRSPLCYPRDVSAEEVERAREAYPARREG